MVPAEVEFARISVKMRCADVVVEAVHVPLDRAENALNRVGVDITVQVLIHAVRDELVTTGELGPDAGVGSFLIRHDLRLVIHHFANSPLQRLGRDVRGDSGMDPPVTLNHADHRRLSCHGPACCVSLCFGGFPPPNVRFIDLDGSGQLNPLHIGHREADAVQKNKGRVIGQSRLPLNLLGFHALLRRA